MSITLKDWIIGKYVEGKNTHQIYKLYKEAINGLNLTMGIDTFKRRVREIINKAKIKDITNKNINITREEVGPNVNIVSQSHEIRTLEQLLKYTNTDINLYNVTKHIVNSWGSAENENFQVKAWLTLRTPIIKAKLQVEDLIEDAKKYAINYPKVKYNKVESGNMLEISLFDHHFGQLSWGKETRKEDYDSKIAKKLALDCINYIISNVNYELEKIVMVIGNDFFNVNDRFNNTAHGTQQSEDDRWRKTFCSGRKLWVEVIETLMKIAPIDVLVVPGNHDEERSFYLGDALECWFNNCKDVNIDNTPPIRKYYQWGKCLIGYTHGYYERKGLGVLTNIMASEMPKEWSDTKYREWHKGHFHAANSKAFQLLDEDLGVREMIMPSLVSLDDYHSGKGYSHLRESIGNVWNKEKGKIASIMYHP
jgi:hypothetical protein